MEQNKTDSIVEEAAHEHYKKGQLGLEKAADTEHAFIKGANWMKERMYSEEDMLKAYGCGRLNLISFRKFIEQFKKK